MRQRNREHEPNGVSDNVSVLIVGAGSIGREYAAVTTSLGVDPLVVTRGTERAAAMREDYPSTTVISGGLAQYLREHDPPDRAILCTPVDSLADHCRLLIETGVDRILSEKPLALSSACARDLAEVAEGMDASVSVAYNRRNYAAVQRARTLIKEDGGVSSLGIDFTEAIFRIDPNEYAERVLRRWGIANSSHVLDTAFYLSGRPRRLSAEQLGCVVEWHPSGSIFTGTGVTTADAVFSYHADWGCPGRWRLEINTTEHKLVFAPMERLQIQPRGSFELKEANVDYSRDEEFKPGFYEQTDQFLAGTDDVLCDLAELPAELAVLETIFGYDSEL